MRGELERLGLIRVEFPEKIAAVAVKQIQPIIEYHVKHFSAWVTPREQMSRLALDCYTQGLVHGNQIPKVKP